MKIFKRIVSAAVLLALVVSLCACGGTEIVIGENGNWFVDGKDTGVSANGIKGDKGDKGDDGDSVTIEDFELIRNDGAVDVYQLSFSNGLFTEIELENGTTPKVVSFERAPSDAAGKSTYNLAFSDGTVATISFNNGYEGKDGASTIENFEIVYSATVGRNNALTAEADVLQNGETLVVASNRITNNKHLTVAFSLDSLNSGSIKIGHGETMFCGSYIVIDKNSISNYTVGSKGPQMLGNEMKHELTDIGEYMVVNIDVVDGKAKVQVYTPGNKIVVKENLSWDGRAGEIFVKPEGLNLSDVKMSWSCDDYKNPIWMVGDSYFSLTDANRWTTYLIKNGYTNHMMISQSGMSTETGLAEFEEALKYGTPKYAFWCVGMNNGDDIDDNSINQGWLKSTERFLELCAEKGITPILATIPSTPTVLNKPKSDWVRNSGYRYVDFESAVGGGVYKASLVGKIYEDGKTNKTGYEWYPDMLHADLVHPQQEGAQALYMRAISEFPELLQK